MFFDAMIDTGLFSVVVGLLNVKIEDKLKFNSWLFAKVQQRTYSAEKEENNGGKCTVM